MSVGAVAGAYAQVLERKSGSGSAGAGAGA